MPFTSKIPVVEAFQLATDVLQKLGYNAKDSDAIADHLIDSELRGFPSAGLARILSVAERLGGKNPQTAMRVTRESPCSAQIDGGDTIGYLVAHKAAQMAIEKANTAGIGVVGASNTWYTGMLCYFAEMAAKRDLVMIVASHCTPWVAPQGGYEGRFGTNPICIGFPSKKTPVIWDIGTSKIIHAQAKLAVRTSSQIPPDSAYNKDGNVTRDPLEALNGALSVWGGHKGSGLAIAVQLMGALAGASAIPGELKDFGLLIIAMSPSMFRDTDEFKQEVSDYSTFLKSGKSLPGEGPLRMPFERSAEQRDRQIKLGYLEVEDEVIAGLKYIIS